MFLKDIPSTQIAEQKAGKLLAMFQQLFQGEKQPVEVTCSIGLAIYPWDGTDYQTLYHCADLHCTRLKARARTSMPDMTLIVWRQWTGLDIPPWGRPLIPTRP